MSYSYLLDANNKIKEQYIPSGNGSVAPNINQVLTSGSDAGNNQLINLSYFKCNGYLEIGNAVGDSSQIHLNYTDGTAYNSNYQIVAVNENLNIQKYKLQSNESLLMTQPLNISPSGSVTLSSSGQLFVTDGTTVGHVYDTHFNPVSGSGTLQTILTTNPSAGNEDIDDVNNLTVNTSITLNNQPLNVNQSYFQNIIDTTSLNMVSGLSNGDLYYKLYTLTPANYPQCCHYKVTINEFDFTVVTSTVSGSMSAQVYIVDNLVMNSITSTNMAKTLVPYTLNLNWNAGQNTAYTTPFTLEYISNTPPSVLGIIIMTNSVQGYLSRNKFIAYVDADTQIKNVLTTIQL